MHSNTEVLAKEVCGLEGYKHVSCLVKALTASGDEGTVGVSNSIYTACDSKFLQQIRP